MVNPDNEVILARHLECAAAELPLTLDEDLLRGPGGPGRRRATCWAGGFWLRTADGSQLLAARKRPQRLVDLRGSGQTCCIEDEEGNVIGTVDGFRAWRETHPGAVYLHHGRSYVITEMDTARGRVRTRPEKVTWFTRTRGNKTTDILEETERRSLGRVLVCRGRLRITERITGYEKRSTSGNRLLTIVPLDAPPQVFETEGLWYVFPDVLRAYLEERFLHFMGSIHALEHAAIGLLPLLIMADRNDFGGISTPLHPQLGLPRCLFMMVCPAAPASPARPFPMRGNCWKPPAKPWPPALARTAALLACIRPSAAPATGPSASRARWSCCARPWPPATRAIGWSPPCG